MSGHRREPHRLRRGAGRPASAAPAAARAEPARPVIARLEDGAAHWDRAADIPRAAHLDADAGIVVLYPDPTRDQIAELARAWDLHPVLVEDLEHARQRPKLESYGELIFLAVRAAWYVDESEEVEFAEFHVLVRPGAVAILCQDARWIDGAPAAATVDSDDGEPRAAHPLLDQSDLLRLGTEAVAYALLDAIVDGYSPVLEGLAIDVEQIERQVFGGDAAVTERIYRLSREVIDLKHACAPLTSVTRALLTRSESHDLAEELDTYLTDVDDHVVRLDAEVSEMREALAQILDVNATLVAQRQNEDMKKISGWAAILFSPTLIAAVYGMNFDVMPELHWWFGYPLALAVMVAFAVGLRRLFKRRDWM